MRLAAIVMAGVLFSLPAVAQQTNSAPPVPPSSWSGPVVDGRHRQPTESEVESRETAEGESARALEEKNKRDLKTLDEIYQELNAGTPTAPPPRTP